MASTLACIGFDLDDHAALERLIAEALRAAAPLGVGAGGSLGRWQDTSGARLTATIDRAGQLLGFVPSCPGEPGAWVSHLEHLRDELWSAKVVDRDDGEQVGALVANLEQSALVDPRSGFAGPLSVTALGVQVAVFPDDEAFASSPASLLDPDAADSERPADLPDEMAWPFRVADESFLCPGLFVGPEEAEPMARLSGHVLAADTRRNELTGLSFHTARVRTSGFEVDLCLPASEHPTPPPVGSIVSGQVYLVATLPDEVTYARPRGLRRLFRRR